MDAGIMAMDGGITGSYATGDRPGTVVIRWEQPGGIISKTYNGQGVWGYLLGPSSTYSVTYQEQLDEYLKNTLGDKINDEISVQAEMDKLMGAYVTRLLSYVPSGDNDPNSYAEFQRNFEGCWYVMQ